VKSYLKLAHRIGQYKPEKGDRIDMDLSEEPEQEVTDGVDCIDDDICDDDNHFDARKNGKKHKKKKHHKQNEKNKVWLSFIQRAFVGSVEEEELRTFELLKKSVEPEMRTPWVVPAEQVPVELRDGEL